MSENRVIGDHGKIPWHISDDFRWFKRKTTGGTLLMGRKTFDSIGKPLPERKTIVLTHRPLDVPNVETYSSLHLFDTQHLPHHMNENYWVCGGGTIYTQMLDRCLYLYLTIVKRTVEGDTLFPPDWHVEKNHQLEQVIYENSDFRVERWKNKTVPTLCVLPLENWPL